MLIVNTVQLICLKDLFYHLPYDSHFVIDRDVSTACSLHQAIGLINYSQLVNRRYRQMKTCSTRSKRRDQ